MTNLAHNLTRTAAQHPDRAAVRLDDTVLTYRELDEGGKILRREVSAPEELSA